MGYYSFYRIIKDIVRNFKKNKLLVIIGIVILALFLCNKVFAVYTNDITIENNQFTFNNIKYTINPFYNDKYYLFMIGVDKTTNVTRQLRIYCSTKEFKFAEQVPGEWFYLRFTADYGSTTISSQNLYEPNFFNNIITLDDNHLNSSELISKSLNYTYISNFDIKNDSGKIAISKTNTTKYPQVTTSLNDLQTLNFDTISVSAWSWSNKDLYILFYDRSLMNNQDTQGLYPKKEIKLAKDTSYYVPEISSEENAIYWVANDNTGLNFKVGGKYEIRLAERVPQSTGGGFRGDDLYSYKYLGDTVQFEISEDVSAEKIKELNEQTKANEEKERHDETIGAINNQTQATQDLNNSINDSNVTADINLPTDTTENPTENGLDNIFDLIYNGFTQGQAQDIVFPIPFTDKSIKIEPSYLENALRYNNAEWVITIIQAFWWFLISRFIIKDISKKIRKIKSGNIEDIQNNNIKEDML